MSRMEDARRARRLGVDDRPRFNQTSVRAVSLVRSIPFHQPEAPVFFVINPAFSLPAGPFADERVAQRYADYCEADRHMGATVVPGVMVHRELREAPPIDAKVSAFLATIAQI